MVVNLESRHNRLVRAADVSVMPFAVQGDVWYSGIQKTALAQNGKLNFTIKNPDTNPSYVVLVHMFLFASSSVYFDAHLDPTTNLPTSALDVRNVIMDGRTYTGLVEFKANTSANELSGGATLPIGIGAGAGAMTAIDGPVIIPPNHMLGFHTLAAGNTDVAMSFTFIEQDI